MMLIMPSVCIHNNVALANYFHATNGISRLEAPISVYMVAVNTRRNKRDAVKDYMNFGLSS
jgi:hypothetical protein